MKNTKNDFANAQKMLKKYLGALPQTPGYFKTWFLTPETQIGLKLDLFLLKFNYGTGGDADDRDMIQGGLSCPSLRLAQ